MRFAKLGAAPIYATAAGWACIGCGRVLGPLPAWWNPLTDAWLIDLAERTHADCVEVLA